MTYSTENCAQVTIGLPVRNGEKTIRHTIDSVLRQTYLSWKLIISDNFSTDQTSKIIQDYASSCPRVLITTPSKPLTAEQNFRFVLSLSSSKYFCWLCCDDHWANDTTLDTWVRVLDNNPKYSTVFSQAKNVNYIDECSFESPHPPLYNSPSSHALLRGVYRLYLMDPSIIYGLHRRDSLNYINDATFPYDYSDCAFVLKQEINGGIAIVPSIDFVIGTIGAKRNVKIMGNKLGRSRYVKEVVTLLMLQSNSKAKSLLAILLILPAIILLYYYSLLTD